MITVEFKNIDKVISQVEKYAIDIKTKEQQILEKLGKFGVDKCQIRYNSALNLDNDVPVKVSWEIVGNSLVITANGEQVCFLEFGAGVYYNGQGNYPIPLPNGVVGIGQYGKGKGKHNAWGYYRNGNRDDLVITHGTRASHAMYDTLTDICEKALDVVREVFSQ